MAGYIRYCSGCCMRRLAGRKQLPGWGSFVKSDRKTAGRRDLSVPHLFLAADCLDLRIARRGFQIVGQLAD